MIRLLLRWLDRLTEEGGTLPPPPSHLEAQCAFCGFVACFECGTVLLSHLCIEMVESGVAAWVVSDG